MAKDPKFPFKRMAARVSQKENALILAMEGNSDLKGGLRRGQDGIIHLTGGAATIKKALMRPGVAPATRPVNKDGGSTFHFALTFVSKGSAFTRMSGGDRTGSAAAHEAYIEREGAAERLDEKLEQNVFNRDELAIATWNAIGGQKYIERPSAAEAVGESLASFGNIDPDFKERVRFGARSKTSSARQQHIGCSKTSPKTPASGPKSKQTPPRRPH